MDNEITLKLENLTFSADGKDLFQGINLEVRPGELLVLFGTSGSHKSDLLKLCIGLLRPASGAVKFEGVDINEVPEEELEQIRRRIGFVFQESALLSNMKVADNVALPLRYHTDLDEKSILAKVKEKIELVGMGNYIDRFPAGLTPNLKKRASIARALIMEPRLVLYDEPTAELDALEAENILNIIRRVNGGGVTCLVATHEVSPVLSLQKRTVMIERGQLTEVEEIGKIQEHIAASRRNDTNDKTQTNALRSSV